MKERELSINFIKNTMNDIKTCIRNLKAKGSAIAITKREASTVLRKVFRRSTVAGWMATLKTTLKKTNQSTSPEI